MYRNGGKAAARSLLPVTIWLIVGFVLFASILSTADAFTTARLSCLTPCRSNQALWLSPIGMEEISTTMILSQQPPLDVIGVDPGQALFWSTIVHWILWDKTTTKIALTFDAICIAITLWDGTVRAHV